MSKRFGRVKTFHPGATEFRGFIWEVRRVDGASIAPEVAENKRTHPLLTEDDAQYLGDHVQGRDDEITAMVYVTHSPDQPTATMGYIVEPYLKHVTTIPTGRPYSNFEGSYYLNVGFRLEQHDGMTVVRGHTLFGQDAELLVELKQKVDGWLDGRVTRTKARLGSQQ